MTTQNHPVAAEELMAYLDGELAPNEAAAAAAHLGDCMECQQLAADLRSLSQQVRMWQVTSPVGSQIPAEISSALDAREAEAIPVPAIIPIPWSFRVQRLFKQWGPALAVCALIAIIGTQTTLYRKKSAIDYARVNQPQLLADQDVPAPPPPPPSAGPSSSRQSPPVEGILGGVAGDKKALVLPQDKRALNSFSTDGQPITDQQIASGSTEASRSAYNGHLQNKTPIAAQLASTDSIREQQGAQATQEKPLNALAAPMIIRTAALAVTAKDFDKARAQVEDILKRHRGYIGSLNVTSNPGAGRTLSGSLRIPSPQLDAALAELKTLGRLDSESQNGEDVTAQYVDLNARLDNSRHTEQRLTDLLQNRTGKLSDVLSVENELARVRGEIESMEAERKSMANQVDFATLNLTLTEEYRAQLQGVPPSTSTRLTNAAVEGYQNVIDGLMSVALFFLASAPTLLLWVAILFLPARYAWKRLRRNFAAQ